CDRVVAAVLPQQVLDRLGFELTGLEVDHVDLALGVALGLPRRRLSPQYQLSSRDVDRVDIAAYIERACTLLRGELAPHGRPWLGFGVVPPALGVALSLPRRRVHPPSRLARRDEDGVVIADAVGRAGTESGDDP